MGRVILILAAVAALIALTAMVAGQVGRLSEAALGKNGMKSTTTLQKLCYVALIVLMLGTAAGWIGGL